MLPPSSLLATDVWQDTCCTWLTLIRHLLSAYVTTAKLHDTIDCLIGCNDEDITPRNDCFLFDFSDVVAPLDRVCHVTFDVARTELDLSCVLKWSQIEKAFLHHVRRVMDNTTFTLHQDYCLFTSAQLRRIYSIFSDEVDMSRWLCHSLEINLPVQITTVTGVLKGTRYVFLQPSQALIPQPRCRRKRKRMECVYSLYSKQVTSLLLPVTKVKILAIHCIESKTEIWYMFVWRL